MVKGTICCSFGVNAVYGLQSFSSQCGQEKSQSFVGAVSSLFKDKAVFQTSVRVALAFYTAPRTKLHTHC
jgi:hypothetical protein